LQEERPLSPNTNKFTTSKSSSSDDERINTIETNQSVNVTNKVLSKKEDEKPYFEKA